MRTMADGCGCFCRISIKVQILQLIMWRKLFSQTNLISHDKHWEVLFQQNNLPEKKSKNQIKNRIINNYAQF